MNEMRALIARPRRSCSSASPITWLAAIALPTVVLLIFGSIFGAAAPGPGARRAALHRHLRAVDGRHHASATLGIKTLPDPPRDVPREGRPAAPRRRRRPARVRLLVAQLVDLHGHRGHRPRPAGRRRQRRVRRSRCRGTRSASSSRSCSGMSSLFAIGLLVAAVAPSSRVATAVAIPMFFVVMFLGGVYLPRVLPARRPGPDRRLHAARRPGPAGRLARERRRSSRRWSGWPSSRSSSGSLAVRSFRWE